MELSIENFGHIVGKFTRPVIEESSEHKDAIARYSEWEKAKEKIAEHSEKINFNPGDYLVYSYGEDETNSRIIEYQTKETLNGREVWVFSERSDNINYSVERTRWIDSKLGIILKWVSEDIYKKIPQKMSIENSEILVSRNYFTRIYDINNITMKQTNLYTDTSGRQYQINQKYDANFSVFVLNKSIKINDYIPFYTTSYTQQIVGEKSVSTPINTFETWILRSNQSESQYYLNYFDKISGLLVRKENYSKRDGQWNLIEFQNLIAFRIFALPMAHVAEKPYIPKQFHGSWDEFQERCRLGSETDTGFKITEEMISFYETTCKLKKVFVTQNNSFTGSFSCSGEDLISEARISFKLDRDALILKNWIGSTRNTRCSDSAGG